MYHGLKRKYDMNNLVDKNEFQLFLKQNKNQILVEVFGGWMDPSKTDPFEKYLQNYEFSERSTRIVVHRSQISKNQGKKKERVIRMTDGFRRKKNEMDDLVEKKSKLSFRRLRTLIIFFTKPWISYL